LLRDIARALNDVDNRVSMSGHTDSAQYVGGERGFSNWELSSNRANAARRELVAGGLEAGKMVRVVGLADTVHLVPDDPMDPANRRISIIVLNKAAEDAMRGQGAPAGSGPETGGAAQSVDAAAGMVPAFGLPPAPGVSPPLR
jgi:chemotaxis protein MotB